MTSQIAIEMKNDYKNAIFSRTGIAVFNDNDEVKCQLENPRTSLPIDALQMIEGTRDRVLTLTSYIPNIDLSTHNKLPSREAKEILDAAKLTTHHESGRIKGERSGDKVRIFYDNEKKQIKTEATVGQDYNNNYYLNGEVIVYTRNNKPQKKLHYKKNKLDGICCFYIKNNIILEIPFIQDKANGEVKAIKSGFGYNEQILSGSLKKGKKDGHWWTVYDDGLLLTTFKNGLQTGILTKVTKSSLIFCELSQGEPNGKYIEIRDYKNSIGILNDYSTPMQMLQKMNEALIESKNLESKQQYNKMFSILINMCLSNRNLSWIPSTSVVGNFKEGTLNGNFEIYRSHLNHILTKFLRNGITEQRVIFGHESNHSVQVFKATINDLEVTIENYITYIELIADTEHLTSDQCNIRTWERDILTPIVNCICSSFTGCNPIDELYATAEIYASK